MEALGVQFMRPEQILAAGNLGARGARGRNGEKRTQATAEWGPPEAPQVSLGSSVS